MSGHSSRLRTKLSVDLFSNSFVFSSTLRTCDIDTCHKKYWFARSNAFRVSHSGGSEEAYGVQGILEAYTAALNSVQLAGPTLFTEVLQTAMARANRPASQTDQRYDVLLILTDGIINDMQQVCMSVCPSLGVSM